MPQFYFWIQKCLIIKIEIQSNLASIKFSAFDVLQDVSISINDNLNIGQVVFVIGNLILDIVELVGVVFY